MTHLFHPDGWLSGYKMFRRRCKQHTKKDCANREKVCRMVRDRTGQDRITQDRTGLDRTSEAAVKLCIRTGGADGYSAATNLQPVCFCHLPCFRRWFCSGSVYLEQAATEALTDTITHVLCRILHIEK
ncbi:hypothetical protein ILYODFUR_033220 [Ilyodon furcidens]|uniref:Uncharacterized protein n=1 Tax=Ilyodon furcidens TaxID=33524 RepID=A0ABV0SR70_9TELE